MTDNNYSRVKKLKLFVVVLELQWTTIVRRVDASVSFERDWDDYVAGFGDPDGNMWLGLERIHQLTNCDSEVYCSMESFSGEFAYANYTNFRLKDSSTDYKLDVSGYSGTAGDGLTYNNGQRFSTRDKDHTNTNCCAERKSGWWHDECTWVNFNGLYLNKDDWSALMWYQFKSSNGMKTVEMKIRPK